SLHDALPISRGHGGDRGGRALADRRGHPHRDPRPDIGHAGAGQEQLIIEAASYDGEGCRKRLDSVGSVGWAGSVRTRCRVVETSTAGCARVARPGRSKRYIRWRRDQSMANPFVKAWKYLMALFDSKIEEHADPKVQIQQAIEEAQRQHQALSQQAASVIGNQRLLACKLIRQLDEVE